MNWLDLIIALPLLFGAYRGFTKGIIIEIASVLALILGFYGALLLADKTAELINHSLDYHSSHIHLIAFVVTFIAIVVGVFFMAKVMETIVTITGLGMANRIAGAVFGLLKIGIIMSALIFILNEHHLFEKWVSTEWRDGSAFLKPLEAVAEKIIPKVKMLFS